MSTIEFSSWNLATLPYPHISTYILDMSIPPPHYIIIYVASVFVSSGITGGVDSVPPLNGAGVIGFAPASSS